MRKVIIFLSLICLIINSGIAYGQKQKVWLDADTGNETDDVYAIVRLLNDTSINLVGLSSAHFNNADLVAFDKWNQYPTKNINTVKISQQLNEEILALSDKLNITHPIGADRQIGRAWGGTNYRSSDAAKQIISAVKSLSPNEKLHIISLGALTNIASAVAMDSSITKHIECYLLGARYDAKNKYWDKNEFNIRNDLNAFDYLLNQKSIQLIVMPITTAEPFKFERDSLYAVFDSDNPVLKYLKQRWLDTNPDDKVRTLWDVALVEAYLNPSFATIKKVKTPLENTPRSISVYTKFDNRKMKESYYQSIQKLKESK
ncbi:nucleoside hydrolase [Pedobacter psychrophilus]|uniref:Nucleoside hydrolase n=1 Tax=Pedobacter psychrophilus TaxID=1826909 RepID=A0A179DE24_9SPHI|nr:nucleoside hydrolase [Pedobacter psychrophilus]OAQ38950.1 nucleoside hydrolase [Pedobacter psychrophilus]